MGCDPCQGISKLEIEDIDCLEGFKRIKESGCFTTVDGLMNIFCKLGNIADNIGLLVDAQEKKGFASAVLHFRVDSRSYTNGIVVNTEFSRSPLNYKVTGIGVSVLSFPSSSGVYTQDDVLKVKLYDFTGGNSIGNELTLSKTQLHDKHTDEGNTVGPNIGSGHVYGVKVSYTNTDGGAFTGPDIDVYIHIEPTELITDV